MKRHVSQVVKKTKKKKTTTIKEGKKTHYETYDNKSCLLKIYIQQTPNQEMQFSSPVNLVQVDFKITLHMDVLQSVCQSMLKIDAGGMVHSPPPQKK